MKQLPVTRKGETHFALVDDDDFDRLSGFNWVLGTRGYASAFIQGVGRKGAGVKGPGHYVTLHRAVLELAAGDGVAVDHINGNKLDNRRENLFAGTQSQNLQNRRVAHGRSRYRGVGWDGSRQKWIASVALPGTRRSKFLGRFETEEEAAAVAAAFRAEHLPYSAEARAAGRSAD